MQDQNNHKYDDIIHLEHPVSKTHPQMSLYDRAAQFAPFAALTGHAAAIRETARRTDEKRVLSDEVLEELNEKLNIISANIGTEQLVVGIDGNDISDSTDLQSQIASGKVGDEIEIEFYRNEKGEYVKKTVKATLEAKTEDLTQNN